MAEIKSSNGGDSGTNTRTSTSGGNSTNATTNTSGNADTGNTLSSATTKDAKVMDMTESSTEVSADFTSLPFPHSALGNEVVNASVYKDLVAEAFEAHKKAIEEDDTDIKLSDEMKAAREDEQLRLADSLNASLLAQRSLRRFNGKTEGDTKIKLAAAHTHAGVAYKEGDEIQVDKATANFLVAAKVGEIIK